MPRFPVSDGGLYVVRPPGRHPHEKCASMSPEEQRESIAAARAIGPLKSVEQGAATSIWCATSAQLDGTGGVYCEDVDVAQAMPADSTAAYGVRPWAMDPALAAQLWRKSEEWTGARLAD